MSEQKSLREQAKTQKYIALLKNGDPESLWVAVEVAEAAVEKVRKELVEAMRSNESTFIANKEFLEQKLEAIRKIIGSQIDLLKIGGVWGTYAIYVTYDQVKTLREVLAWLEGSGEAKK